MQLRLSYGTQEVFSDFSTTGRVSVKDILLSLKSHHPEIFQRLCDRNGNLIEALALFVNGEHIRYRRGLDTLLEEGDEVYIVPLITGG